MKEKAVLVTTEFRGVFFGYVKDESKLPEEITLTNARNCVKWSCKMEGFLGLTAYGPDDNCRIGVKVTEITLYKITSVSPITNNQVIQKWEDAQWKK